MPKGPRRATGEPQQPTLGQVRWLGGSTGAGKSTVARLLAQRFGAAVYSSDAAISAHATCPGADAPLLGRFLQMSMDERWLDRGPETMLQTFPWFAGERFDRIVADLQGRRADRRVLAEGFRLLPRLVAPVLDHRRHGAWLISTTPFRRAVFERRPASEQFWRRTSDPPRALERLLDRDALFADAVAAEARALGLKTFVVTGERHAADLARDVADWFRLTEMDAAGSS